MKKKKLNKIPRYAFGANAIQNWGTMSGVDKANIVTGGIGAVGSMIGNATNGQPVTIGGAINGAASGAAAGASIGGVPGAIIGGGLGLLTSSIGSGGSVNEVTGDYQDPSGIAGLFGHSKNYIRQKAGRIKSGNIARSNAEQIASNYYQDNGYNNLTMAQGGIASHTMAYLDDGELLRTPDGTIGSIPEEGKPTDSNLLNVPIGTQVLSDKIKVPGTNKTFAEMGKKLMKKSNKKANDIYAENSQMLNERNNQLAYQRLLEQQEQLKNKKSKANKYSVGGIAGPKKIITPENNIPLIDYANLYKDINRTGTEQVNDMAKGFTFDNYYVDPNPSDTHNKLMGTYNQDVNSAYNSLRNRKLWNKLGSIADASIPGIAALAGPIGNIFTGKPEQAETYTYDPVYGPTDYDIDPILREATLSDNIARYNMANINPNTGANMAYGLQSAVNRNKAIANAYAQKNNVENQLAFQNAGIANQWGQQYANARHVAAVEQAQNDAATRNIRRKGYGDLSTRIQQINKDRRLTNRDTAMLDAMMPFLEYGMTADQLKKLYNNYNR